jgi:hypothetical protein
MADCIPETKYTHKDIQNGFLYHQAKVGFSNDLQKPKGSGNKVSPFLLITPASRQGYGPSSYLTNMFLHLIY